MNAERDVVSPVKLNSTWSVACCKGVLMSHDMSSARKSITKSSEISPILPLTNDMIQQPHRTSPRWIHHNFAKTLKLQHGIRSLWENGAHRHQLHVLRPRVASSFGFVSTETREQVFRRGMGRMNIKHTSRKGCKSLRIVGDRLICTCSYNYIISNRSSQILLYNTSYMCLLMSHCHIVVSIHVPWHSYNRINKHPLTRRSRRSSLGLEKNQPPLNIETSRPEDNYDQLNEKIWTMKSNP